MKKGMTLFIVLMFTALLFAGCTKDEPAKTTEDQKTTEEAAQNSAADSKINQIPFEDDQFYAVAYMGYDSMDNFDFYKESYIDEDEELPTYATSIGDSFLIIPRYNDMSMKISRIDPDTGKDSLVYQSETSKPFLLQCNQSDIHPDCLIRFESEKGSCEFNPHVSLKDGSIEIGEKGLDLTIDSEQ